MQFWNWTIPDPEMGGFHPELGGVESCLANIGKNFFEGIPIEKHTRYCKPHHAESFLVLCSIDFHIHPLRYGSNIFIPGKRYQ
jgi:hypothetical protein